MGLCVDDLQKNPLVGCSLFILSPEGVKNSVPLCLFHEKFRGVFAKCSQKAQTDQSPKEV